MFGRKTRLIKYLELQLIARKSSMEFLLDENYELKQRLRDVHNAFTTVQDYILKLSEELRQDGSKIVFREKHKNSEGNIFISEKERDATQIDNITRALYEIEKSERKLTVTVIKDALPETIPTTITVLKKEGDK